MGRGGCKVVVEKSIDGRWLRAGSSLKPVSRERGPLREAEGVGVGVGVGGRPCAQWRAPARARCTERRRFRIALSNSRSSRPSGAGAEPPKKNWKMGGESHAV